MINKRFCYLRGHHPCDCEDGMCSKRQVAIYKNSMYLGVAKAGSTSIIAAIKKAGGNMQFIPEKEIIQSNHFKFTFVRNPYTRLVSCWQGWIFRKDSPLFENERLYYGMPFDKFVHAVAKISNAEANRHYVSQDTILNGYNLTDFVGKLENIKTHWKLIQQNTGLGSLEHKAKGLYLDHMSLYTPELKSCVYKRYHRDFILYGYEK